MVSHRQRERFGPKHCGGRTRIRRLVATARDTKRLDDLVKKYGDRVRAVPLDVTDESAAQAAVQTAVAAFGRLDVVVNNAGYGDIAPFEQLSTSAATSARGAATLPGRIDPASILARHAPGR